MKQNHKIGAALGVLAVLVIGLLGVIFWGANHSQTTTTKQANPTASSKKMTITTTFYPMYEFTKAIVGNHANVTMIIPAGSEPHDFEPTAKEVAQIAKGGMLIYSSPYMETWVKNLKPTLAESKITAVNASAGIKFQSAAKTLATSSSDVAEINEEKSQKDPHVWLDPVLAQKMVQNIADAIKQKDPQNAALYQKNATAYIKKLQKLAAAYNVLKKAQNKTFITSHAAFGYIAKQYGLTQIAVSGISDEADPSAQRIATLENYIKKYKVNAIFAESTASGKIAQSLAKSTNIKVYPINTLESVTAKEQQQGQNYFTLMYQNLKNLQKVVK